MLITLAFMIMFVHDSGAALMVLSTHLPRVTLCVPVSSLTILLTFLLAATPAMAAEADACPTVLNYTFNSLQTGKTESLCQFRGKVLLIVNTASYCGYTHQFEGLEALYRKYKSAGLVVLGFPSNDFGGQEPGSNKEIAEFCRLTYGVEFPMFEKSSVTSVKTNPLFADLVARTGQAPQWNFHKYLIDRDGKRVTSFGTRVEPDDRALVTSVERLLSEKPAAPNG